MADIAATTAFRGFERRKKTVMSFSRSFPRLHRLPVAALAAVLLVPGAARADCNQDLGALMKRRLAMTGALEANKKAHGGKIDPIAGCSQIRSLVAAQSEVVNYMTKNKDWCGLPDNLLDQMNQAKAKMSQFAGLACSAAVKMKQQEAASKNAPPQEQVQALKLPAGPL